MIDDNKPVTGETYPVSMDDLLETTVRKEGSDLHLSAGVPPKVRIHGKLSDLDYPVLAPENIDALLTEIIKPHESKKLQEDWELDFSYSIAGIARFRCNVMYQRGSLSLAIRVVPYEVPYLESLGLPPVVESLCSLSRGLVLVTGPTGSGKSTTLAAMINLINETRGDSIVTIEDPIEFLHKHKKSTIRQREVGIDTKSFPAALRHILRQDPDVILIGEMRDLESISIALTAAETGHLVLSSLHTQTGPLTINRIVDVFQDQRREQIRQQLSNTLQAVISQQLLPRADGRGRVVAAEFMRSTVSVSNMIREGKEHQLYSVIQTGNSQGMQTMDMALSKLVKSGAISMKVALDHSIDRIEMERLLQKQGFTVGL